LILLDKSFGWFHPQILATAKLLIFLRIDVGGRVKALPF
jgi:hypothetical protein